MALALLAGCGAPQPPIGNGGVPSALVPAASKTETFHYTGKEQSFEVPAGVKLISVVALGAAGGGIGGSYESSSGRGGRVYAELPVYPGERLYVFVGGAGVILSGGRGYGGFNGGGNPGPFALYGGGGASDVRAFRGKLISRILVAGGGGGAGDYNGGGAGGEGGTLVGGAGSTAQGGIGGGGGEGGTQQHGGAGGSGEKASGYGYTSGDPGKAGKLGRGGRGGRGGSGNTGSFYGGAGGGGGGGYYGGGGGGGAASGEAGGGGGGGSSYVEPNAEHVRMWRGGKTATGNGLVLFSW